MAQKSGSKGKEAYYARYKSGNVQAKNRRTKLERLQKEQPNNEQIKSALKDVKYRRKTPTTPFWSHSMIKTAKILKEFTGNFNPEIFNSNPKTAADALAAISSKRDSKPQNPAKFKHMFSMGERVGWVF